MADLARIMLAFLLRALDMRLQGGVGGTVWVNTLSASLVHISGNIYADLVIAKK